MTQGVETDDPGGALRKTASQHHVPLALLLLAEDIPPLRRVRDRLLDWIERHRPHWFTSSDAESKNNRQS